MTRGQDLRRRAASSAASVRTIARSEAFSFWSHAIDAALGLVGLVYLMARARGFVATTAFAIYGGTLVLLFTSSALHHLPWAADRADDRTNVFRRLDHAAIYAFIAGSYTPLCLLVVPSHVGLPLLVGVWAFAVAGILLKLFRPFTPRWITVALYLAMGWLVVLTPGPVVASLEPAALVFLAAGGLLYTVGAFIYAAKRPDPLPELVGFHGVWHLFVLAAAALHFLVMVLFVAPAV